MSQAVRVLAALLFVIALLLGGLAFYLSRQEPMAAAPVAAQPEPPAPAAQPLYRVVVAKRDIAAGTEIAEADLAVAHWPVAPATGYADAAAVAGETARLDIAAGEPVLAGLLSSGLAKALSPGERAVTIPVDEIVGAANRILPGDFVDVFFLLDKGQEVGATQARLLQPRLRVLAYGTQTVDGPEADARPSQQRGQSAPPRNAMLAVPLEQVNELLLATRSGKLQLVLRSPEDQALPDADLFPEPGMVLAGRQGLSAEQLARLDSADNRAYAGASLAGLAGPATPQQAAGVPASRRAAAPRSIEVVRGGASERVRY